MFKAYHPRMVEAAWWVWVRCGLGVVQGWPRGPCTDEARAGGCSLTP